jgi:hypothetical protein
MGHICVYIRQLCTEKELDLGHVAAVSLRPLFELEKFVWNVDHLVRNNMLKLYGCCCC